MLCPAFLQVKIDFFKWCPTIDTCKNWCIFFSYAALFCHKGLEVRLTLQHHRHFGVMLDGATHCRGEEGSLGPQIHPVTPCSSPPRPGLPGTLWFKVWLIEIIPWSWFFFFFFLISLWTRTILETSPPALQRSEQWWEDLAAPFPPDTFILTFGFLC